MEINFDSLPQQVNQLHEQLSNIERLLLQRSNEMPAPDQLLTIQQAGQLLNLSVPTLCGYVERSEIPVCKRGQRLYFSKLELTDWIKAGRKLTREEITEQAETKLKKRKRWQSINHAKSKSAIRKGRSCLNQLQTIFAYLQKHSVTASMLSEATGVPQKNICRYKRSLEKAGKLWEVSKGICLKTGYKASYLTTNPNEAQRYCQLTMFED